MLKDYPESYSNENSSDNFYTPTKYKNPSSIQTNPSTNPVQNIAGYPTNQYSTMQLSQSFNASPSFLSPRKQSSSFIMNKYFQSNQQINRSSTGLQIQSQILNREFIFLNPVQFSPQKNNSKNKIPQRQTKQFMRILQRLRIQNMNVEQNQRNLRSLNIKRSLLQKALVDKQQTIMWHKQGVQKLIQKKNILSKKVKLKNQKLNYRHRSLTKQFENKINFIDQEYNSRRKNFEYESSKMIKFQRQADQLIQELKRKLSARRKDNDYSKGQYIPYSTFQAMPHNMIHSRQYSSTNRMQMNQNPEYSFQRSSQKSMHQRPTTIFGKDINAISPIGSQTQELMSLFQQAFLKKMNGINIIPEQKELSQIDIYSPTKQLYYGRNEIQNNIQSRIQFDQDIESLFDSPKKLRGEYEHQYGLKILPIGQECRRTETGEKNKLLQPYVQSEVKINCQSSEYSDNFGRCNQFSPRLVKNEQQNGFRRRSPTQQTAPKIYQRMSDLRMTQIKKVQTIKHSGQQTPVFRSENSESQIRFSKPLLASFKNSEQMDQGFKPSKSSRNQNNKNSADQNKKSRKYSSQMLENYESFKRMNSKNQKNFDKNVSFDQEQHSNNQLQLDEDDSEFFSCTLGTDSKVSFKNSKKCGTFSKINDPLSQVQTPRIHEKLTFQKDDFLDQFDQLRRNSNSRVSKVSKFKKYKDNSKIQQKLKNLTLSNHFIQNYEFQVVPQQSQLSQEGRKHKTERRRNLFTQKQKSTL